VADCASEGDEANAERHRIAATCLGTLRLAVARTEAVKQRGEGEAVPWPWTARRHEGESQKRSWPLEQQFLSDSVIFRLVDVAAAYKPHGDTAGRQQRR